MEMSTQMQNLFMKLLPLIQQQGTNNTADETGKAGEIKGKKGSEASTNFLDAEIKADKTPGGKNIGGCKGCDGSKGCCGRTADKGQQLAIRS